MSPVLVVWLAVGLVTLSLMLVLTIGLVRQVKRLAGAVVEMNREVQPVLESMQRESEQAREAVERLSRKESPFANLRKR